MSEANRSYDFANCRPYEELAAALVAQAVKDGIKTFEISKDDRTNQNRFVA